MPAGRLNQEEGYAKRQAVAKLLLEGNSAAGIAKLTGVARSTIKAWIVGDETFQGILQELKRELHDATVGDLLSLIPTALANVRAALERGDVKVSMQLLTASGALQGSGRALGMDASGKGGARGLTINVNTGDGQAHVVEAGTSEGKNEGKPELRIDTASTYDAGSPDVDSGVPVNE